MVSWVIQLEWIRTEIVKAWDKQESIELTMTKTSKTIKRSRKTMKRQHRFSNTLRLEQLEGRRLLTGTPWHNLDLPTDVNRDGILSPFDALAGINELNFGGARELNDAAQVRNSYAFDVNNDGHLSSIDVLQTINAMNAEGEDDALLQIRLQTEDGDGNAIDSIDVDGNYTLSAYVQDLSGRDEGESGVFAAYLDVMYDSSITSIAGEISYGSDYQNGKTGDTSVDGIIDEVGAFDGFSPLGNSELLLFSVPMSATAAGTVTFDADPADFFPAHESLLFGVLDGQADGAVTPDKIMYVDTTLQIGSSDGTTPVAVDDTYQATQDITLVVAKENGVLANDTDPNGDALSATLITDVSNGNLALESDGSFTYTPNAGYSGTDSFTYVASDVGENSNVATVTINVEPTNVNNAPVAANDSYTVTEDTPFAATLSVRNNDTDADGDTLTTQLVQTTSNGTLGIDGPVDFPMSGLFTYIPNANFSGVDTFTYLVNDGQADSNVATVTINVTPVNDAPVGVADAYDGNQNSPLVVDAISGVLSNDTDVDGDKLEATLASQPANGTVALNDDGSFTFTPDTDFVGQDSFTYTVSDGVVTSDPITVSLNVIEDSTDTSVLIRLEITNQSGTVISSIAPGGRFVVNAYVTDTSEIPREGVFAAYMDLLYSEIVSVNGDIEYSPQYSNTRSGSTTTPGIVDEVGAFAGFDPLGSDEALVFSVPFTANSPGTAAFESDPAEESPAHDFLLFGKSDPVPVEEVVYGSTQLIVEEGEPPVAADDAFVTSEDVSIIVSAPGILDNDSDPDGNSLTAILVNAPTNGSLNLNADGSFEYTPNVNYFGEDFFTYVANDGAEDSNVATVSITVEPVPDAPLAVDDFYDFADPEEGPFEVDKDNGVLANDSDAEGDTLVAALVSAPTNGQLIFNADGSFTYTPDGDLVGRDTFTYQVMAGDQVSRIATVTLNVGDLTPSSLAGFVYVDANNNGLKDDGELTLGGVEVDIIGTNLLGERVRMSAETNRNGAYEFDGLLRGNYTVIERQPMFLIDGLDTANGEQSLRNDRFIVDLKANTHASDYNFGERGLQPRFMWNSLFFASRDRAGVMAAIAPNGDQAWYCIDAGWRGLTSVDVELSANGSTAEVSGERVDGTETSSTVRVSGNSDVRVLGNATEGMLVQLNGTAASFGLNPIAVDDAFEDGDL